MKKLLALLLLACTIPAQAQFLQKQLKFATFYTAVTGNNSLADVSVYSINPYTGVLEEDIVSTLVDMIEKF